MTKKLGGHGGRTLWSIALASVAASAPAHAQEDLRELLGRSWGAYSPEAKAALVAGGLVRADAESKALALAGVARLAQETPDVARSRFDPEAVRAYFGDSDKDVVKQALLAYVLLVPEDAATEVAVVERAQKGGGPLNDWEYVRYVRHHGVSTEVAREWLQSLADGPVSPSKFSAAEALGMGMDVPPPELLLEVMELIRSPEYFCHFNLVQFLPKFGPAASLYADELVGLRTALVEQMTLSPKDRSVTITGPPDEVVGMLDQVISTLEQRQ